MTADVRPEKGWPARGHLVQHEPEGEQIGARVDRLAPCLLRGHVRDGADRHAGAGQRLVRNAHGGQRGLRRHDDLRTGRELCEPEVEDLGVAALRDEDVGGLDIAMNDALAVRRVERVGDLHAQIADLTRRQRLGGDEMLERLPLQPLHDHEVPAVVGADVVDGADVRVVQRRGGARLALKALDRLRIGGQFLRKDLQRDTAAETGIFGFIHRHPCRRRQAARVCGSARPAARSWDGQDPSRFQMPYSSGSHCKPSSDGPAM